MITLEDLQYHAKQEEASRGQSLQETVLSHGTEENRWEKQWSQDLLHSSWKVFLDHCTYLQKVSGALGTHWWCTEHAVRLISVPLLGLKLALQSFPWALSAFAQRLVYLVSLIDWGAEPLPKQESANRDKPYRLICRFTDLDFSEPFDTS